jgi:hypothetical protein
MTKFILFIIFGHYSGHLELPAAEHALESGPVPDQAHLGEGLTLIPTLILTLTLTSSLSLSLSLNP